MIATAMNTILFDTHAFIKKLTAAGFTERQAETLAEEQAGMIENKLATKQDIQDLKRDMKELEMRMTIKLGALMVVALSILTTIIKFIN